MRIERGKVVAELAPQVFDEQGLHVRADRIVVLGFVVHLIADDGGMAGHMRDKFADHALAVIAVGGVDDVHDLARAVLAGAGRGHGQYVRMHADQPGRHRVGGRAHDDGDAVAFGGVQRAVHVAEVEDAGLRFAGTPRGFGDADHVDAGGVHHPHVGFDAVRALRHVFVVVCRAEQDMVYDVLTHGVAAFRCYLTPLIIIMNTQPSNANTMEIGKAAA